MPKGDTHSWRAGSPVPLLKNVLLVSMRAKMKNQTVLALLALTACCACSMADSDQAGSDIESKNVEVAEALPSAPDSFGDLPIAKAEYTAALKTNPPERTAFQRTMISAVCLQQKGWSPSIHRSEPDGIGITGEAANNPASIDRFRQDHKNCAKEYRLDDFPPLSHDTLIDEYEKRLKESSCLKENGVVVADPPSQETYADQRMREMQERVDLNIWNPADTLADADLPRSRHMELSTLCLTATG